MNTKTVISNIRMPSDEWDKIRINAAEMGMSINEYIRFIINHISTKQELVPPPKPNTGDYPIWKIYELFSKKKKGKELSIEDKIIYDGK